MSFRVHTLILKIDPLFFVGCGAVNFYVSFCSYKGKAGDLWHSMRKFF
uniref:Uncharacterized protein n=1 Tax=Zea mays TaxID=4577 RepID=C0P2N2_MAIZE|nr:unknown [Zea mays]